MPEFNQTEQAIGTALPGVVLTGAVLREAEAWARLQAELFGGIQTVWADWARRRWQDIDAGSRSLQRMCESRSFAELLQAQQDWINESLQRSASEVGVWMNGVAGLGRRTTEAASARAEQWAATASAGAEPRRPQAARQEEARERERQREAAE